MLVAGVLLTMFVLLLARVPVAFAIGITAALGLVSHGGTPMLLGVFETTPHSAVASFSLTAIPLFILMAQLILHSGIAHDLFDAIRVLVGRVPAGLGIATTLAGAAFAAISGSSTAAAATLAATSNPQMRRMGYDPKLSGGLIAVVGTLAAMIPPSIILVFYAILAEESVGQVLVAGFLPGALVTATIILTTLIMVWRNPTLAPRAESHAWWEKLRGLTSVGPIAVLFLLVTGTIYFGVATPTEAAALGASGALVLTAARRRLSWSALWASGREAVTTSVMVLTIIMSAYLFGYFLTATQVTQRLVRFVAELPVAPTAVFGVIALLYLVLGFFLDQMAILALTVPVVLPVVTELGFDPIWFGVVVILLAEIGLVTPPLGLNVFVVARASGLPVGQVFRGVTPYVLALITLVVLVTAFPAIVTWVPDTMAP